tara:strand:+ start:2687 stop:3508 length:822 start_codon:yes stop_codon:yes gene_type:complete
MNEQFYKWLEKRVEEYETARERGLKAYRTRVARVAAERNDGIEPNQSSAGFHAPFDGYIWDTWTKGGVYLKGQFLPMEADEETVKLGAFSEDRKIENVPVDRADDFLKHFNELQQVKNKLINIQAGAHYTIKGTDTRACYVYISKCPEDLIQAIEDYLMGDIYELNRLAHEKAEQERAARDAAHRDGEDVTEGRQVITGTMLTMKRQETIYGLTLKMLVQDDRGFRVWGSVPSGLTALRYDRITFTATVQRSDKDSKFGFFKRPTKSQVLPNN